MWGQKNSKIFLGFRRLPQKDEANQTTTTEKRQADTPPQRPTRKSKTICKLMLHEKIKLKLI